MSDPVIRLEGSAEVRTRYVREVYEAGVRDGMRMLSAAIGERVAAALERPDGHGGVDLDQETRHTVLDMYARYFGVGVDPVLATITRPPFDGDPDPLALSAAYSRLSMGRSDDAAAPGNWDLRGSAETP